VIAREVVVVVPVMAVTRRRVFVEERRLCVLIRGSSQYALGTINGAHSGMGTEMSRVTLVLREPSCTRAPWKMTKCNLKRRDPF